MGSNADHIEQAQAYFDQGNALFEQGRLEEAEESFRSGRRLSRALAGAYNNQGITLASQGQRDRAFEAFREALRINPNHLEARYNLGNALRDAGQLAQAEACYLQVLRMHPSHAEAHNNLGNILKSQGRLEEAIVCFRQALLNNSNFAAAHNNLGLIHKDQDRLEEAIACFRQALILDPNRADVYSNLANALNDLGQLAATVEFHRQALRLNPNHPDLQNNLGRALFEQGQYDQAEECFRNALTKNPEHKLAFWNQAVLKFMQGDFTDFFKYFEGRLALTDNAPRPYPQPRWDGSPLDGKTILVYAEMGLGDTILLVRFLPMVKERGGTVLLLCQRPLLKLLSGCPGADQVIAEGAPLPPFDVCISLFGLPGIFGITLATVPAKVPYLAVDVQRVEFWRRKLISNDKSRACQIGIAWQCSKSLKRDCRSFPLAHFEALAKIKGVRLVSLQVGAGTEQLASLGSRFEVLDLGDSLDKEGAFLDSAAIMKNLDLVITVDSAVAHLAGALRVPVWVPQPFLAHWIWLLERPDSPWYPTMRLYRQRRPEDAIAGEWQEVFQRITADVHALAKDV
jgi:tetratricopeptide (TPR) repeat protein